MTSTSNVSFICAKQWHELLQEVQERHIDAGSQIHADPQTSLVSTFLSSVGEPNSGIKELLVSQKAFNDCVEDNFCNGIAFVIGSFTVKQCRNW